MSDKEFRSRLISIAVPVALQNLMLALVGASDALMLGRLSQEAVSAVSLANQISFVMSLFIGSVIGGAGTLIAQYLGKGDRNTAKELMSISIELCIAISFVFFAVALLMPDKLMAIYTSEAELVEIGSGYLRIVSWSYLFTGISQAYLLMMKNDGRAGRSALISALTVFIDMFLDLFLIYGLAGIPKLGVTGCAVSTVIVEACAMAACIADSYGKGHIHPDKRSLQIHSLELLKDLSKVSLPMLTSGLAWGIGYSMHSLIMGHLGTDAVAAASIISVVQELVACFSKGLSSGAAIIVGQILGKGNFDEAKKCGAKFCKIAIGSGAVNAVMLLAIGLAADMFFILTDEARAYFFKMLAVMAVYLFAFSLNTIITCGVFPAGGDTLYDARSVIYSMWCFSIPLALLGTFVFHWNVMLIYALMMADEIVKIPWIYPRYKKYIWVKNMTRSDVL